MDLTTFSIENLKRQKRQLEYLDELRACAAKADSTHLVIDRDGECFKAMWKKYRPVRDPASVARAKGPPSGVDWAKIGPVLWRKLHERPGAGADPPDASVERAWLRQFADGLACGECRRHWREITQVMPPDLSSRDAYFAWTWQMHRSVNARLGKPGMELADARRLYGYPP